MRSVGWCLLAAAALFDLPAAAQETRYDLVIRRGHIIDGTGNPWFQGDVAVQGDRIVALGSIPADASEQEIDAAGLVVAPGFIDMHSHSDWLLLEDGRAHSKIRQGVTTEVLGEGGSVGPFQGKLGGRTVTIGGQAVTIVRMRDYFEALEASGTAVNVASYVGLDNVWQCVMGQSFDRPTPAQLAEMKTLVAEAMDDGAFGLSCQLMMPPGSLATTEELVELCRDAVRPAGGIFSSHIRNEGTGAVSYTHLTLPTNREV